MFLFFLSFTLTGQIKINNAGKIGLNCDPGTQNIKTYGIHFFETSSVTYENGLMLDGSYAISGPGSFTSVYPKYGSLSVLGKPGYSWSHLYVETIHLTSGFRIKENVRNLSNSLEKLMKLRPISFDYKKDYYLGEQTDIDYPTLKNQYSNKLGFIAQELDPIFPNLVSYDSIADLHYVDYVSLIPVLVDAIKEQQTIITLYESRINKLEDKINTIFGESNKLKNMTTDVEDNYNDQLALYQNTPNPFTQKTTIRFTLPEKLSQATLYIYDMQGIPVRNYDISGQGLTSIEIEGSTLQPGMYLYSLIVDGQEVGTKRMILTND